MKLSDTQQNSPRPAAGIAASGLSSMETRGLQIWLVCLGFSLSISLAVCNILMAGMLVYLVIKHAPAVKEELRSPICIALITVACLLQLIGIIHDGWLATKATKIYLLLSFSILIGQILHSLDIKWLPYLIYSMMIGMVAGTGLNLYFRPEYHLWATYAMSYSNQAAGLALTIGLLSYATKEKRVFLVIMAAALFYLFMSGERSGVISLAAAFLAVLIISRRVKILLSLGALFVAALLTIAITQPDTLSRTFDSSDPADARIELWKHAISIAEKDGFVGRGEHQDYTAEERSYQPSLTSPKKFQRLLSKVFPQGLSDKEYQALPPISYHSQPFQHLVEYGLIAVIIYMMLVIYPIIVAWRKRDCDSFTIAGVMLWSAFAAHSLFETSFDNHSVIVIGLLSGLTQIFQHRSAGDV